MLSYPNIERNIRELESNSGGQIKIQVKCPITLVYLFLWEYSLQPKWQTDPSLLTEEVENSL